MERFLTLSFRDKVLRILALLLTCGLPVSSQAAEIIDITLDASARDNPLLEFLLPADESADQLEFDADWIRIKQFAESGKKAANLGFILQATSQDHFLFELDFECPKLSPPKAGWGQGMLIRIVTEDANAPAMAVGYVANKQFKGALCFTPNHTDSRKQTFEFQPLSITKGTLLIERKQDELFVSIDESGVGSFRLLKRAKCTPAAVKEIQVLCTRQESGNTPAEYLLKRVRWIGSSYFSQPPPSPPWVTWARIKFIFWLGVLAAGIAYVVQGVRSGKIPIHRS